jgi:hypothetical protein
MRDDDDGLPLLAVNFAEQVYDLLRVAAAAPRISSGVYCDGGYWIHTPSLSTPSW